MAFLTFGDVRTEVLVRLNQSTTSGFYSDQILYSWINAANGWAGKYKKWPFTEARYSTTFASLGSTEDGYTVLEYPEGFRSDSIRLLTIGGKRFDKKNFYKFQQFLEDNSGDSGKLFTDYARRVLINPNAAGLSGTVVAWGQINIAPLGYDTLASGVGDPAQSLLFTSIEDDANEAIVEKVLAWAYQRERSPVSLVRGKMVSASMLHDQNANNILDKVYASIQEEQAMYQDTQNEGMYKRFDVLKGGFKEDIFKRDQWFS